MTFFLTYCLLFQPLRVINVVPKKKEENTMETRYNVTGETEPFAN